MAFWSSATKRRQAKKQQLKRLPRKEKHKAWKSQKREERDLNLEIRRSRQLEDMRMGRMRKEKKEGKKHRKEVNEMDVGGWAFVALVLCVLSLVLMTGRRRMLMSWQGILSLILGMFGIMIVINLLIYKFI